MLTIVLAILAALPASQLSSAASAEADDRAALTRTGDGIRAAFGRGDVAAIMAYHHPDVEKALVYGQRQTGRAAVATALAATLAAYRLEFVDNRVESLLIRGDTAVEQALFTIHGIPKAGGSPKAGEPFTFSGRAQVVYVRYAPSPSGWASIREMIQPVP